MENPEILESNAEKPNELASNENEESTLEDEIQSVLEAAKDLPDLPPDARPNPEKSRNIRSQSTCWRHGGKSNKKIPCPILVPIYFSNFMTRINL